jgi:hypothetical protein
VDLSPSELNIRYYTTGRSNAVVQEINHPKVLEKFYAANIKDKGGYYSTKNLIDFSIKNNIALRFFSHPGGVECTEKRLRSALIHYVFAVTPTEVMMKIYKKYYVPAIS